MWRWTRDEIKSRFPEAVETYFLCAGQWKMLDCWPSEAVRTAGHFFMQISSLAAFWILISWLVNPQPRTTPRLCLIVWFLARSSVSRWQKIAWLLNWSSAGLQIIAVCNGNNDYKWNLENLLVYLALPIFHQSTFPQKMPLRVNQFTSIRVRLFWKQNEMFEGNLGTSALIGESIPALPHK